MFMRKLLFVILFLVGSIISTIANPYIIDDSKVDAMFNQATEIALPSVSSVLPNAPAMSSSFLGSDEGKVIGSLFLIPIVGIFGVHRHVLGTQDQMWMIYSCSLCGIVGIVPFLDFWVLLLDGLINGNADRYTDNNYFLMWYKH
jgi:hypothetical protein